MNRQFEPLYHSDRLHMVNPRGDVGIITLWSPVRAARRRLAEITPDILDQDRSRVAVISNLYGDGMYAMFCNLLFNPQVRHLIAIGEDLGQPTCREIEAFLRYGLDDSVLLGKTFKRIRGEARFFPAIAEFDESRLMGTITFRNFGSISGPEPLLGLSDYLRTLPVVSPAALPERIRVRIPEPELGKPAYRPSEPLAHNVVRRRPLDCWEELVVRGVRFGRPVRLSDGPRLELLNAKAVITEPVAEAEEILARYGFQLDRMLEYQKMITNPALPYGISYTYGNRLRQYFGHDSLEAAIGILRDNPETRQAYITLWDNAYDLTGPSQEHHASRPCLTTLFFRRLDGKLTLTATYRAHNLLTAWLENVYGLMAIQRYVCDAVCVPVGCITVLSHSLGIDPRNPRYELARRIADEWRHDGDLDRATGRHALREDPNGYFVVSADDQDDCIVAEHRFAGLLIKQYRSDRAAVIERQIMGDMGVSLLSHAFWLGRELATKEQQLRERRRSRRAGGAQRAKVV